MDPRHLFIDSRLSGVCVYCGGQPDTRDHVPSRVLLDEPLPSDLPVVEACGKCNNSFSPHEEYLACLIECVLRGGVSIEALQRDRVRRILEQKPPLAVMLGDCRTIAEDGSILWSPDPERVRIVLLKLARGHAAFELGLPQLSAPARLEFMPLVIMPASLRAAFESAGSDAASLWPEVGSRSFYRAAGAPPYDAQPGPWIDVQPNRYRYAVIQNDGVLVRVVLSEYLACEVHWV